MMRLFVNWMDVFTRYKSPMVGFVIMLFSFSILCTNYVIALQAEEAEETVPEDEQSWKPGIGKWYSWTDSNKIEWQAVDIAVSTNKNKIVFLCRRAPVETTEHFRAILFSEPGKPGKIAPLPYSVGGKQKIDLFWYDKGFNDSPMMRMSDRQGEYLVEIKQKATGMIVRYKGRTYYDILPEDYVYSSYAIFGTKENRKVIIVKGRYAKEVTGPLATDQGKAIGKIEE